jgi:hypothetical protein
MNAMLRDLGLQMPQSLLKLSPEQREQTAKGEIGADNGETVS